MAWCASHRRALALEAHGNAVILLTLSGHQAEAMSLSVAPTSTFL